jgi:hypothetical protein
MRLPIVPFVGFLSLGLLETTATAAEPLPRAADQPSEITPKPEKTEESFRNFSLTGNPLSLLLVKFGFNAEWLPARHHAIILSPSYQLGTVRTPELDSRHRIMAVEAGYHYYLGTRGADGVYFGPSLVAARERLDIEATSMELPTYETVRWALGGAMDVGGQVVTSSGFTAGAGVGLMYLFGLGGSPEIPAATQGLRRDVIAPRLLCTAGYSF